MTENVEVVQVRMKEHTLSQLDRIKSIVNSSSRSDAVRRSVEIMDILVNAIMKGERIVLEKSGGKRTQILITGLNK